MAPEADSPELQIRPAKRPEIPEVAEIYHAAWHGTHAAHIAPAVAAFRDSAFFVGRVESYAPPPLVALRDRRILGFAVWEGDKFSQLWLRLDARGRGVGAALAAETESRMAVAGVVRAHLTCMAVNEAGRRFYERLGWEVVGGFDTLLESAEGPVPVPCWRMEKTLGDAGHRPPLSWPPKN